MAGIRDTYNLVEKSEVVDLSILKNYECKGKVFSFKFLKFSEIHKVLYKSILGHITVQTSQG